MSSAITHPVDQMSKGGNCQHQYVRNRRWIRTDVGRVVGCTKDELGGAVVARADVADVGLSGNEDLRGAKVAQLEDASGRVKKEVLWLDVAVADADGVDVHEGTEELVHIQLDLEHRHRLLELGIVPAGTVHCLRDVFEHKVEVHFVFLSIGLGQMWVAEGKRGGEGIGSGNREWSDSPCHH